MFQILPVVETVLLPFLPVEMWSAILRLLDLKSLLAGARSCKLWKAVCHGDPILRRRMRLAIEEEAQFARNFILDPRLSTRVTRMAPTMGYSSNTSKIVATISKPPVIFAKSEAFAKQKKTKKSPKNQNSKRFSPYRL